MKKLIAIALVLTMVAAFVPAALAAPSMTEYAKEQKFSSPVQAGAVEREASATRVNTDFSNVNTEMKIKADDVTTQGWMDESKFLGFELMNPEDTLLSGYSITTDDGSFVLVDDFFTDNSNWGYMFTPSLNDEIQTFSEGEGIWYSIDLFKSFSNGTFTFFDNDIQVAVYMFSGTSAEYSADGLSMTGSWMGAESINVKVVAPEDDYMYLFYCAVVDASLTTFGTWLTISDFDADFTELEPATTKIELEDEYTVEVGGTETDLVLTNDFLPAYKAVYPVELEAGVAYEAVVDSTDDIGFGLALLDEELNVLTSTWVSEAGITSGSYSYNDVPLLFIAPVDGTYYLMVGGQFITDEGELDFAIGAWGLSGTYANLPEVDVEIDLDDLGTENYYHDVDGKTWYGYEYDASYSYGTLYLMFPGTYTITGENANIGVDAYDGVHMILDNAEVGALWLANTWAPVVVEAKGDATIIDTGVVNYTVYNYEGSNAGLYFIGDNLSIEGPMGIVVDSVALHLAAAKIEATATGIEGSYTIATWSTGIFTPKIVLGANAQISDSLKICRMCFDSKGYFTQGYTFSVNDEIYRYGKDVTPNFYEIAEEYTLTTDGIGVGSNILYGDATQDGRINTGDAVAILKHAAMMTMLTGTALEAADMTRDGRVNTGDAVAVLKHVAGM